MWTMIVTEYGSVRESRSQHYDLQSTVMFEVLRHDGKDAMEIGSERGSKGWGRLSKLAGCLLALF